MLEQRPHPTIRHWGFLLTEMVLIVASILFAFALDSWWDERKERVEETEILHGLKEEFLLNRSMLERRIATHSSDLLAIEELLAAAMRGHWESTEIEVDQALAALIAPPTTDLGNGVLDALIGAGRIELLTNRRLRVRLAAWEGVFEEVRDDEIMSRGFVLDVIIPYLIRRGVPLSGPISVWKDQWHSASRSIVDTPGALPRLLSDPEFGVILEVRVGFKIHATGEYQAALDAVGEILSEIDASLADQNL